jgi:hypothetical protein
LRDNACAKLAVVGLQGASLEIDAKQKASREVGFFVLVAA